MEIQGSCTYGQICKSVNQFLKQVVMHLDMQTVGRIKAYVDEEASAHSSRVCLIRQ